MEHLAHDEPHRLGRSNWLRAGLLGANDGILSVASVLAGVAAAGADRPTLLLSGMAALTAGAFSMAAGEYVSVKGQADIERADLATEAVELERNPSGELDELTAIYVQRGLTPDLARTVAEQMTAHDALAAHARDEIGITDALSARPFSAAVASAVMFAGGAALPLLAAAAVPEGSGAEWTGGVTMLAALAALAAAGWLTAHLGGTSVTRAVARVLLWGVLTMAVTAVVGALIGRGEGVPLG